MPTINHQLFTGSPTLRVNDVTLFAADDVHTHRDSLLRSFNFDVVRYRRRRGRRSRGGRKTRARCSLVGQMELIYAEYPLIREAVYEWILIAQGYVSR